MNDESAKKWGNCKDRKMRSSKQLKKKPSKNQISVTIVKRKPGEEYIKKKSEDTKITSYYQKECTDKSRIIPRYVDTPLVQTYFKTSKKISRISKTVVVPRSNFVQSKLFNLQWMLWYDVWESILLLISISFSLLFLFSFNYLFNAFHYFNSIY